MSLGPTPESWMASIATQRQLYLQPWATRNVCVRTSQRVCRLCPGSLLSPCPWANLGTWLGERETQVSLDAFVKTVDSGRAARRLCFQEMPSAEAVRGGG